ncbi:hypothetical protein, partial [Polaromonas sp.]|uniref:hypothetical protein n=1 Tax=Polaromonas sp. TaxID=1869339 RepID=UPI002731413E
AARLEYPDASLMRFQGVSYVSAHLFPMSPVYTATQKKVTCRRATPGLSEAPYKPVLAKTPA